MNTHHIPPWVAHMQALADQAENDPRRRGHERVARDIANSALEDVVGARHATHRKAQP